MALFTIGFRPFYLLAGAFAAVGLPIWHFAPGELLPAGALSRGRRVARARDGFWVRRGGADGFFADGGAGVERPRHAHGLAARGAGGALGRGTGAGGDGAGGSGHRGRLPVPALRRACRRAPRPEGAELSERARGGGAGAARRGEPAVPPGPCGPHRACAGQRRRAAGPRSLRAARHADGGAGDPGLHRQRGAGGPAAAERLRGDRGLRHARGPPGGRPARPLAAGGTVARWSGGARRARPQSSGSGSGTRPRHAASRCSGCCRSPTPGCRRR